MTVVPQNDAAPVKEHLGRVKKLHEADLEAGYGGVYLARCPGPQVSGRATVVGVAVCVSLAHALGGPRSGTVRGIPADEKVGERLYRITRLSEGRA